MAQGGAGAEAGRDNLFGVLRLVLAALVIVSHSPEILDGNRGREALTRVFATLSLGDVAVDGFFLLSGYLVGRSFAQSGTVGAYALRRAARVLPGFWVNFALCALVLAPLVGAGSGAWGLEALGRDVARLLCLLPPEVAGTFQGLHYPSLNGAAWTIAYEVRCYALVALLGCLARCVGLGARSGRWLLLGAVLLSLAVNATGLLYRIRVPDGIFGLPGPDLRFFALFGTGVLFLLFREDLRLTRFGALVAGLLLFEGLLYRPLAEAAFALAGGYLLFWFAFAARHPVLNRLDGLANGGRTDLSYGLYLYAWPVQSLIAWRIPSIDPALLSLSALLLAGALGNLSWRLVEEPCLRRARLFGRSRAPAPVLQGEAVGAPAGS